MPSTVYMSSLLTSKHRTLLHLANILKPTPRVARKRTLIHTKRRGLHSVLAPAGRRTSSQCPCILRTVNQRKPLFTLQTQPSQPLPNQAIHRASMAIATPSCHGCSLKVSRLDLGNTTSTCTTRGKVGKGVSAGSCCLLHQTAQKPAAERTCVCLNSSFKAFEGFEANDTTKTFH